MKNIFLHIGTHKTGSTSIQMALFKNTRALEEHDFLYPFSGRPPQHRFGQHMLAWHFSYRRSDETARAWDDFASEIAASSANNIILSSEDFSLIKTDEYIDELKSYLAGFRVRILVYLRTQIDLVQSMYNTNVLHFRYSHSFEYFLENCLYLSLDYKEMLRLWVSRFGEDNIVAKSFSWVSRQDGLERDFLRTVGICDLHGFNIQELHQNRGLSIEGIELMRQLNQRIEDLKRLDELRRTISLRYLKQRDEPYAFIPLVDQVEYQRQFKETNDDVADMMHLTAEEAFPFRPQECPSTFVYYKKAVSGILDTLL